MMKLMLVLEVNSLDLFPDDSFTAPIVSSSHTGGSRHVRDWHKLGSSGSGLGSSGLLVVNLLFLPQVTP